MKKALMVSLPLTVMNYPRALAQEAHNGEKCSSAFGAKSFTIRADAGRRGHHCGDNHDTVGSPAGRCGRKLSTAIIELSQLSVA